MLLKSRPTIPQFYAYHWNNDLYRGLDQIHMNVIHDLEDLETVIFADFSKFE